MFDVIIIGGGIVGLATGYQILKEFPDKKLLVLEKAIDVGMHQTGHNRGVIHSGIYYKPGSLKAKNCRYGIELLKKFCDNNDIQYEMCGKIIVATKDDELDSLNNLFLRGMENGISGLKIIKKEEIAEFEPHAVGEAAIFCPETGIIDYLKVCQKLSEHINEKGEITAGAKVSGITPKTNSILVTTEKAEFHTRFIINCAGLFSDKVSELAGLERELRIVPFRGEYYMLKKEARHLVKNLIYPVPDPRYPFLGVHFTRTIDGEIEAGPNAVLAWAREGYAKMDINFKDMWDYLSYSGFWRMARKYGSTGFEEYYRSFFKSAFLKSLQRLVPEIKEDHIETSPAGVRAQALDPEGFLVDDFVIKNTNNMIHVINAPSPAATSSLSIGMHINKLYRSIIN